MDEKKKMESEIELLKELINKINTKINSNVEQIKSYQQKNKDTQGVIEEYYEILIKSLEEENRQLKQISKNFEDTAEAKYPKTDGKKRKRKSKYRSKRKSKRRLFR
jgi:hypothetical protein